MRFMAYALSSLLFFTSTAWGYQCSQELAWPQITEWGQTLLAQTPLIDCASLPRPLSRDRAVDLLNALATQQKLSLGSDRTEVSRHEIGKRLNHCEPRSGEKALVINFEGTGSFSPRTSHLMKKFSDCVGDGSLGGALYREALLAIERMYGIKENWSGLQKGPLQRLAQLDATKNIGWVSFASEESEALAAPQSLRSYRLTNLGIAPRGIAQAVQCVNKYLAKARERNITPKLIVQGHSSGARSAIKFIEILKSAQIEVDLMLTLDPVKEAHHAVEEVLEQYVGIHNRTIYNAIPFTPNLPLHAPNVWTRRQPTILYKPSNAKRAVSVYQNIDSEGLKGPIKFGIRGSPIHEADLNLYLNEGLDSGAHGGITYHQRTLELLESEYRRLGLIP